MLVCIRLSLSSCLRTKLTAADPAFSALWRRLLPIPPSSPVAELLDVARSALGGALVGVGTGVEQRMIQRKSGIR